MAMRVPERPTPAEQWTAMGVSFHASFMRLTNLKYEIKGLNG